jgi:hypothetical protein
LAWSVAAPHAILLKASTRGDWLRPGDRDTQSWRTPMHPLLVRNDAGEVSVRWRPLIVALAVYAVASLAMGFALQWSIGGRFRATTAIFVIVATALPSIVLLYFAKRHAEGKSARQFSLAAFLASATIACLLFALLGSARQADLARYAERQRLAAALNEIVGQGQARVSETTLIQVKRPSFGDADLRKVLELAEPLEQAESPLTFVDLSGTSVTDAGVAELANAAALEYCFLERTGVTDAAIDALGALQRLKVLSVNSTRVTPERLLKLSDARPELNIEPKTYMKLRAR